MWTRREKILVIALAAVLIGAGVYALVSSYRIRNTGRLIGVGVRVYWDPNCTSLCSSIDWGTLSPGDLAGVTVYIKNTRDVDAVLSLTTGNWTPANVSAYLTLSWDYGNQTLAPGQVQKVQMELYCDPRTDWSTAFSFDITIRATEVKRVSGQIA